MRYYFKYFILIFFVFCFFDIAHASEIRLFTSDYSLVDSCQSNLCIFNNPSGSSKRIRFIPDTLTAESNTSYTNKFNFQILSSYNDLNISTCDWFINNQSFSYTSQTFSRLSNVYFSTNIWQSDFTFQNTRTFASSQTYSSFLECEMNQASVIRRVSFNHILSVNSSGSNEDIISSNNANTNTIINNNNNNTQNIIDNQNQNTQDIINNQNQNTQDTIDSQKVCKNYNYSKNNLPNFRSDGYLTSTGTISNITGWHVTDFIPISLGDSYSLSLIPTANSPSFCLYDLNKTLISCSSYTNVSNFTITPSSDGYISFSVADYMSTIDFTGKFCKNGNQATYDFITESNINNSLFADWLNSFTFFDDNLFSSIITSPINFINSLDDTCQPITLTLFNQNVVLPCGTTVFWELNNSYVSNFRSFWNILFGGFIIYKLGAQLIITVNDTLDPTKDSIGGSII